jgi:hypothetical protein
LNEILKRLSQPIHPLALKQPAATTTTINTSNKEELEPVLPIRVTTISAPAVETVVTMATATNEEAAQVRPPPTLVSLKNPQLNPQEKDQEQRVLHERIDDQEKKRTPVDLSERYQQIQQHVATLRFITKRFDLASPRAAGDAEESEEKSSMVDEISAKNKVFLEEAEQFQEERNRKSQERKRKDLAMLRSSTSRENEMALLLQSSQRQILQLQQQIRRLEAEKDGEMDLENVFDANAMDTNEKKMLKFKKAKNSKAGHVSEAAAIAEEEERQPNEEKEALETDDSVVKLSRDAYKTLTREIEVLLFSVKK